MVQTVSLEFKVEEKKPKKTNKKERQNGCFKEKKDYPGVKWRGKNGVNKIAGYHLTVAIGAMKMHVEFHASPSNCDLLNAGHSEGNAARPLHGGAWTLTSPVKVGWAV